MTQEEKELLLQDFCARLSHGVKITDGLHITTLKVRIDTAPATLAQFISSENLKYYLRPLSSMTKEEKEEERKLWNIVTTTRNDLHYLYTDFLLSHYLDYRGLIEKGLVLEAPEGMY